MTDHAAEPLPDLVAVVPAGGAGTRLWPLSRAGRPKFLLDLTGSGRSLLQQTADRLAPLAGGGTVVVTGTAHAAAVAEQLPDLAPGDVLAEPSPRDSAAAIALAAAVVEHRTPGAVVGSFAADHVVRDLPAFAVAVREAVATARDGWIVTVGIVPDRASTAFGYIRVGAPLAVAGAPSARVVESFVEKPDAATAARYVADGGYRWNAGMFVARARVL
ncbi:MAG TPA: sugar phosphate nucleotidyltransferase, partial [Kineosporiaceae bacterium]|nr:sugar phosphate nucleotidyltransferase [Kineosporiaceae bacterium]